MNKETDYFDINILIDRIINVLMNELLSIIFIIILYLFLSWLLNRSFRIVKRKLHAKYEVSGDFEGRKRMVTLSRLIKSFIRISLISIFLLVLFSELGLDIAPLLTGLGIIGIAVGFGAQELIKDVISGLFIILENKIRVGDVAMINGTRGVVELLEIRTVNIRDRSGTIHIFQNGKIDSISNLTKEWSAMIFNIGVAYKENIDHVMEVIQKVGDLLKEDEKFSKLMINTVEIQGVNDFGDSAIMIGARIKTSPGNQWLIGREFRKRLKVAFDQEGIEIPFPHRTIYWGEKIDPLILKTESSDKN